MGLLKKCGHRTNPTVYATQLRKPPVGADLYVCPQITVLHGRNRLRHLVLVSINWMQCITLYGYDTTTPSGCACHPSEGGECTVPTVRGYFSTVMVCLHKLQNATPKKLPASPRCKHSRPQAEVRLSAGKKVV